MAKTCSVLFSAGRKRPIEACEQRVTTNFGPSAFIGQAGSDQCVGAGPFSFVLGVRGFTVAAVEQKFVAPATVRLGAPLYIVGQRDGGGRSQHPRNELFEVRAAALGSG